MQIGDLRTLSADVDYRVARFTGLQSRWTGEVIVVDDVDILGHPVFHARKNWACGISVHAARMTSPDLVVTLIHEAFHSVSVGSTPVAFNRYPGYEEGVVEWLTRNVGPQIASELGVTFGLGRVSFDDFLAWLEYLQLRASLSPMDFYLRLLQTPLDRREQRVIQWAREANKEPSMARLLAELSIPMHGLRGEL